jgi:hypothetical protein
MQCVQNCPSAAVCHNCCLRRQACHVYQWVWRYAQLCVRGQGDSAFCWLTCMLVLLQFTVAASQSCHNYSNTSLQQMHACMMENRMNNVQGLLLSSCMHSWQP